MNVELFILPIAAFNDRLHFYAIPSSTKPSFLTFPSQKLRNDVHTAKATRALLCQYFEANNGEEEFKAWLNSPRCHNRIIDVYDSGQLPQKEEVLSIVRAVSISDHIALQNKKCWYEPKNLLSTDSKLSANNKVFLNKCLDLIPVWVKNTSFTFELMCKVFSIQELRLLVGALSNQEIDPGNFHRRLKKLDILHPIGAGQQRVHRWEFAWERSTVLSAGGLIP